MAPTIFRVFVVVVVFKCPLKYGFVFRIFVTRPDVIKGFLKVQYQFSDAQSQPENNPTVSRVSSSQGHWYSKPSRKPTDYKAGSNKSNESFSQNCWGQIRMQIEGKLCSSCAQGQPWTMHAACWGVDFCFFGDSIINCLLFTPLTFNRQV